MTSIIRLIDDVGGWLGEHKGTDQWAEPWPNPEERDARVRQGIAAGKTWSCWDGQTLAATLTVDDQVDPIWDDQPRVPAIYVHRLVVAREYSGHRLGAALLDWAAWAGRRAYGACWLRLSAWTTNVALHDYYEAHGFEPCDLHADEQYPSRARFQKATWLIKASWWTTLFTPPERLAES